VHRAALRDPNTDRTDLSRSRPFDAHPHPGVPGQATASQLELRESVDHDLLDAVDVVRDRVRTHGNVEDQVADELAGTVVRDVATAVGTHDLGSDRRRVDQHVCGVAPYPDGEDVWMLEKQQMVVRVARMKSVLEYVGLLVGDSTEPPDPEHLASHAAGLSSQSSALQWWVARSWTTRATNAAA
jgi:hypothetical protein